MLTARVKSYHFTGPRVGISIFCALLVSACDTGRLELNCFAFYSSLGMPAKFATFDQRFSTNMAAKHNERVDETATSNSRKFPCSTRKMILNEARELVHRHAAQHLLQLRAHRRQVRAPVQEEVSLACDA